jgi:hypothetical protein
MDHMMAAEAHLGREDGGSRQAESPRLRDDGLEERLPLNAIVRIHVKPKETRLSRIHEILLGWLAFIDGSSRD